MWNLENGTDELSRETDLWTQWGRGGLGGIEKVALTYIHYHM